MTSRRKRQPHRGQQGETLRRNQLRALKKKKLKAASAEDVEQPEDKKKQAALTKRATEIKNKYQDANSSHINFTKAIKDDPKYDWADNPVQRSRLEVPFVDLKAAIDAAPFNACFLLNPVAEVKKRFGDAFWGLLQQFVDGLDAKVSLVLSAQSKFAKLHAANCE